MTDFDDLEVLENPQQTTEAPVSQTGFAINFHYLTSLKQAVAESPVIDLARVEKIKQEIASGSYNISSEGIASAILQF